MKTNFKKLSHNFNKIIIGSNTYYFSYETLVAFEGYIPRELYLEHFQSGLSELFTVLVSENVWSKTTGKHLNMIDPHKQYRVPNEIFDKIISEL